ncbi:HWE histidine kinase domain-containing protein [Pseudomonas sp. CCI4.2]|uniref:HWE histidine kinase domain-containing protein n=1 Tax=Pseudomonas sp. CCI4.2 TaxID=3048620 RepID=UPI002AC959E8|nr:HWE histidine kinase domain-containing protein [Pseudomonas sp. CCI4.2]MEB0093031.1 HWE histidine kinase domain-containing protein [Pseudomonas sp. CCI4.2]WPX52539.1 HWE histidine kinase domain-containing protein [Pseudomonas sp. CCI4.2]
MPRTNNNLNECDREPIHRLARVQTFGFLIGVSHDWLITHVSANLSNFLPFSAESVIGKPLGDIVPLPTLHALRNGLQFMASADSVERVFGEPLLPDQLFDFAIHYSGSSIVIEAEPAATVHRADSAPTLRAMIMRLQRPGDLLTLCKEAVRQIRALTGYDRVMVYRFEQDGTGEVIAEKAATGMTAFLGLRYPAGDIPQQARALYVRNSLRIIADVSDWGAIILQDPVNPTLDLSLSVLRSVSPVHLEYLSNMGVAASLSISIIHQGQLWGLIACHHGVSGPLSLEIRTTAELFGQMFSLMLESRERDTELKQSLYKRALHDQLIARLSTVTPIFKGLGNALDDFAGLIDCDGVGLCIDGRVRISGYTPDEQAFYAMTGFLNHAATADGFSTCALASVYPVGDKFVEAAAGVLAIPLSLTPGDYLVFFRRQWRHSVNWAGNPDKSVVATDDGERLTPRKSFAVWSEQVEGQSRPWTDGDHAVARHLRTALLEVILRVKDPSSIERQQADEKRELLVAELNHRVRNILTLIRAVVGQSRDTETTLEQFIQSVSGRIQALSLAHDQITADQWSAAPLRALIDAEGKAYLSQGHERLKIDGPDVLLDPQAFSTVALVVHELMTNSTKHGALSNAQGGINIDWRLDLAGRLTLSWKEHGGPAVTPPSRRGFGSTIVERSIPFDLKGTAEVLYARHGLEASFVIPSAFVKLASTRPLAKAAAQTAWPSTYHGRVLVLEDNIIIALEAEDILLKLGAQEVDITSRVIDALRIIDQTPPSFALLDFNLGSETSLPVALSLKQKKIPFAFATGYGNELRVPAELAGVAIIKKPYGVESFLVSKPSVE